MRHDLALLAMSDSNGAKGEHTHAAIEQASGPEMQFTGEGTMQSAHDMWDYGLYGVGRTGRVGNVAGTGAALLAAAAAAIPVAFFYGVARDAKKSQKLVKGTGYIMAGLGAAGILGGLIAGLGGMAAVDAAKTA
jgi:hypothetical protein